MLKILSFPPVTYQIDIRSAKLLQKFMTNDNSICRLFVKQAGTNLKNFFSGTAMLSQYVKYTENMHFGRQ